MKFIKKLVMALIYLFTLNVFLGKAGYSIPLSIFNILVVSFFDFPGIILLVLLSGW